MPAQHRYLVRKINLFPLAKFGCLLGGVAMVGPGIFCAVAANQLISRLDTFLSDWQASELDVLGLGVPVEFDFIQLMGLETLQTIIARLNEQGPAVALLIVLTAVIGGGLLIALTILLLAWLYNGLAALTGGLEVELHS